MMKKQATNGDALVVIDPLTRKLEIPRAAIHPTKALARDTVSSLCMLYLEKRCRQGHDCNQIHADPETVEAIRTTVVQRPTCCQFHGDIHKENFKKFPHWEGKSVRVDGLVLPLDRVAYTQGLQRSMDGDNPFTEDSIVTISPSFVCRLQAGGHCRYSEECKFVHLCREFTAEHLSHCVSPLVTAPTSRKASSTTVKPHPSPSTPPSNRGLLYQAPPAPMMVPPPMHYPPPHHVVTHPYPPMALSPPFAPHPQMYPMMHHHMPPYMAHHGMSHPMSINGQGSVVVLTHMPPH